MYVKIYKNERFTYNKKNYRRKSTVQMYKYDRELCLTFSLIL